ncbi:FAD-dependent oxidoreductase [Actinoplanes sp. NPDC026623]|uniref:NAD(P)/FAD-dependent oxidoreductase n=1 Tax=Actinoplanes sp. NPDC026623 TaxID=3155610 RepID=UPI0033FF206E
MRVAIVGGGLAGAALAWRLSGRAGSPAVEVFVTGRSARSDATGLSGGMVRAYETGPDACRAATESLVELLGSAELRRWSEYREVGSVYLAGPGADPAAALAAIGELLPGSAASATADQLAARFPFLGLPPGTVGVVERRAGYVSPGRLRDALLERVAALGGTVREDPVAGVTAAPAVRLADGTTRPFDVVVVAAGVWSGPLLAAAGAATVTLRTKRIQYDLRSGCPVGLGAFVDETSGLYGRPAAGGRLLVGLPSDDWDLDPRALAPDPELASRVTTAVRRRLGDGVGAASIRTVAALDCYVDPPGFALRRAVPDAPLFSFTGGSGGAAKTALAASREAARGLLHIASVP